ncbi:MAG: hypothetical protein LUG21_04295 [Clostridiales bacterium]|nr:hypothetical protein [Clostridiales bacterium]
MNHNIDGLIKTLLLSEVSVSDIEKAQDLLKTDELHKVLNSPTVSSDEKNNVIDEIFSPSVSGLIKQLSSSCETDMLEKIKAEYVSALDKKIKLPEQRFTV